MRRRVIAWGAVAVGVLVLMLPAPDAASQPLCAHRSAEHAAQHHQTRQEDSRWHERHADLPTCNLDRADDVDDHDHEHDDPRWFPHDDRHEDKRDDDHDGPIHRDHGGYHCYHFHCG